MAWRTGTCGARRAAGRRHARGSLTDPWGPRAPLPSPSTAGSGKALFLPNKNTLEAQEKHFQETWWNDSKKNK